MANSATTLYINDASIRLLVTRGKRISKLASVPLETGLSDVDTPEQEAELVSKIKNLMHSNKISGRKIILGISGLHCLTRPVTLPELPKAMLREAILREAQRVLPVPIEQLYLSWQIIQAGEGQLTAFMVGVPRQMADTLMRIMHAAGLKPYLMDIKPLALARLAREATAVLIDVQPREFDIVILNDGIPQPIRTVAFPEETLGMGDKVAIINAELARTVQFHNSNNPENLLPAQTKLYISGDLAEEPELYATLAQDLSLVSEPLVSPLKCQKHLDPSLHLANVGLTLKSLPKEAGPLKPNFNVLPEPFQPRQISTNKLLAIPAAAAAIGLVLLLGMTIQEAAGKLETTQTQLEATKLLLERRQAEKTELTQTVAQLEKDLQKIETSREKFSAVLANIGAVGEAINTDLTETIGAIVPGVDVVNVSHAPGRIALSGHAATEQEVIDYARELWDTGLFEEITIQSIHSSQSEEGASCTFTLNLRLATEE